MAIRIGPNWISAALTLFSGGVAVYWPQAGILLMVAGGLVLLAGVRIEGWKFSLHWVDRKRGGQVFIGFLIMVSLLSGILWYRTFVLLHVHPEFQSVYDAVSGEIGEPTAKAEFAQADAYQGSYENANVIWLQLASFVGFYVLPNDKERKWGAQNEHVWEAPVKEADLRREFHTPKNKLPPFGGMADQWRKGLFRWIGDADWHCTFKPNGIVFQKFEHGALIGIFRFNPTGGNGRIFILRDNGSWSSGSPASLTAPSYC